MFEKAKFWLTMTVTHSPSIAELVRETRQRLELTQGQFAMELGVSYQSVSRWENRRTQPLPLALEQIRQLLIRMGERGKDLLERYFGE